MESSKVYVNVMAEFTNDGTVSLLGADGVEVLSLKKLAETEVEA